MKMIATPSPADMSEYITHVHNCTRNAACELPYLAPIPAVSFLQLYVDFGTFQPAMVEFHIVDHCSGNPPEQIFPSNYVIGQTPEGGWYGVFKYFSNPVNAMNGFVIWLAATNSGMQTRTFFSQMIAIETCVPIMKIKACQPELATTTGFDVNGVYYGLPQGSFLGMESIRYFHIAWVRMGKVRELSNKAIFKSSFRRNFRTTIEKLHIVENELVPKWYKDQLLAIYSRGVVQIDDGQTYLVSDLAFDPINDDDLTWKPFAQLKETFKLFYGCDVSECFECCSPSVISAAVVSSDTPPDSGEPGPGEDVFEINYTNNQVIPIHLQIHNNGVGPLTTIYLGNYSPDPVTGTHVMLPAVDALITFSIGGGKTFTQVSCNGVLNPGAVGNNIASWTGVDGPVTINFITN